MLRPARGGPAPAGAGHHGVFTPERGAGLKALPRRRFEKLRIDEGGRPKREPGPEDRMDQDTDEASRAKPGRHRQGPERDWLRPEAKRIQVAERCPRLAQERREGTLAGFDGG